MMMTPSIDFEALPISSDGLSVAPSCVAMDVSLSATPISVQHQPEVVEQFQSVMKQPLADNAAIQRQLETIIYQLAQTSFCEPQAESPQTVDVAQPLNQMIEEFKLSDAIVASGTRPQSDGSEVIETVGKQEMLMPSNEGITVDAVRMAFTSVEVPLTETFLEAANAVVDVMLMTPELLRGEGGIRVQLRPDVLEGSDVRISVEGRNLTIEFIPQTPDVALLIEQNRPQLEQYLAARFQVYQLSIGVARRRTDDVKGRSA